MSFGETRVVGLTVLTTLMTACGTQSTDVPPGGGGSGGASAATTSGGTPSAGTSGASTGGATTGGASTSGSSSGGGLPTGGASGASPSGGSGGSGLSGGVSAGGAGGMAGGAGAAGGGAGGTTGGSAAGSSGGGAGGGSSKGAAPSMGCGKSSGTPMNVNVPNAIVTFPDGYDGSTPVPLLFGFHGAGRTNQDFYQTDARMQNSDLENHFAMVYLKSAGSAWATSDQSRFDTAFSQMTESYCIDLNRVFATGHSSGAQFIELMLCDGENRLKAVAPVAGSRTCASWDPVPAMLIHGLNDNQRGSDANGQQERGPFITSNACSMSTAPYTAAMSCNSIYNQAAVNNGCVSHTGCSAPFVFCNHDDMNYSGTNHGWPCFANQTMYAFFTSL